MDRITRETLADLPCGRAGHCINRCRFWGGKVIHNRRRLWALLKAQVRRLMNNFGTGNSLDSYVREHLVALADFLRPRQSWSPLASRGPGR